MNNILLSFNLVEYVSSIHTIVYAMAAGIFIACLLAVYYRSLLGRLIRYMIKQKVFSPEQAVSIEDTPYKKNIFIRSALASGNAYGNVLYYTDGERCECIRPKGKRPSKEQIRQRKYYIPDEFRYRAEFMFKKKGNNLGTVLISIILIAALVVFCLFAIPDLLTMLDNFLAQF